MPKFSIYVNFFDYFCGVMKKKTTIDLITESEKTALYSISFEKDGTTEFEKFVAEFEMNATYNSDYQRIIAALQVILDKGALDRFFRPEGKMNDNVQAIPIGGGKLRLYCLRISEQIVILGNGGVKTTRTYEENETLSGYVMDLQQFDELLKQAQKKGSIIIEKNMIVGIENKVFEL